MGRDGFFNTSFLGEVRKPYNPQPHGPWGNQKGASERPGPRSSSSEPLHVPWAWVWGAIPPALSCGCPAVGVLWANSSTIRSLCKAGWYPPLFSSSEMLGQGLFSSTEMLVQGWPQICQEIMILMRSKDSGPQSCGLSTALGKDLVKGEYGDCD